MSAKRTRKHATVTRRRAARRVHAVCCTEMPARGMRSDQRLEMATNVGEVNSQARWMTGIPRNANPLSAWELVRLIASDCDVLRGFLPAGAPALTAACPSLSSPGLSCPGALSQA